MPIAFRHADMDADHPVPTALAPAAPRRRSTSNAKKQRSTGECLPSEFGEFSAALRADLAPATLIEHVLVERVILAAWRLHQMSRIETEAARRHPSAEGLPPISRADLRAESSLETALFLLQAARGHCKDRWGAAAVTSSKSGPNIATHVDCTGADFDGPTDPEPISDLSNEWTPVPDTLAEPDEDESANDLGSRWTRRLGFDHDVSESSPIVRGTWVTVRHVVSLVVDGWTWSDILRTHPELTEDDIRACLTYTVEHDGGDGV
jgi:uncharacterized protein (DUF433 family)